MKHVIIHTDKEKIEGILIKEDDKHAVIKLSSGYNIGLKKSNITKIEDITSHQQFDHEKKREEHHKELSEKHNGKPTILILHTGGTIASKVDYSTGAVTARFSPEELVEMFPELKDLATIESKLIRNMMSDDMRFEHYNIIAEAVKENISAHPNIKGIITTQGTDTLHYTAAALSFIFEHLNIPIVIVGSQRSSDRGSSDSSMNLVSAAAFIANTTLSGVFVCMHEHIDDDTCIILNGLNSRKMHSSRRDAFKPINCEPIARVDYSAKSVDYLSDYPSSGLNSPGTLKLHKFDPKVKVGIISSHPNMFASEFDPFDEFDGLILEGTGLGHFPISKIDEFTDENAKIREKIAHLCKKIPVVMSVQTIFGRVNMNVYTPGRELMDIGVIGDQSTLCPETAFVKLAWLISQNLDPHEYFMKDLRGEFFKNSN